MVYLWWALVFVALAGAIGAGEFTHRRRHAGHPGAPWPDARAAEVDHLHGGFKLDLLVGSALTLAVIMCSFMLATSYTDFDDAVRQASNEAGAVSAFYETAGTVPVEATARRLQQDAVCYGRAVVADEWPRLQESGSISPRAELWRVRVLTDIRAVAGVPAAAPGVSAVVAAEQQVAVTHQARLLTADRKAPWYLFLLLIAVCTAAVYFISAFTARAIPARLRRGVVVVLAVLLAGTLAVIVDLAHPYRGISNVGPQYLASIDRENTANYRQLWGGAADIVLCDAAGVPR